MNKSPLGFSGGGIWAIIFLLILGVGWVENRFGSTVAGYALIAVGGALFIVFGILLALGVLQWFGNFWLTMEKIRSRINLVQARIDLSNTKGQNDFNKAIMQAALPIGRAYGKSYQAQLDAEYSTKQTPEQVETNDPYVIGLRREDYSFTDDDG